MSFCACWWTPGESHGWAGEKLHSREASKGNYGRTLSWTMMMTAQKAEEGVCKLLMGKEWRKGEGKRVGLN